MKKGHKIVAALAAITLLPCATAGMLTACNNTPEEHTHSYTKWDFDDDEHWKVCPDDNAVDESSKAEHDFDSDGKCECGATETYVYGTVTGKVKLHKNNAYEKAEGITVDMGDDDVNITGSVGEDGVYSFTVAKVKVKHDYTLTVTKAGYTSYSTNIYLEEENEVAPIGGNDGITLEYEVFNIYLWDGSSHDLSNVNAANPSIKWVGPAKTMNVISKENTYTDLSVAVTIKKSFSSDGSAEQGIMLQFEDGAGAFLNINVDGVARLQFRPKFHSGAADKKSIFLTPENQDKWVEYRTVTAEEVKQYESDAGIELKLVRKDDYLYTFLGGRFMGKQELPEDYKDDKISYGFFCFGANVGSEWTYEVTEDFPALESEITVDVTLPEDETECTVARTPAKDKYEYGEEVTLTFNAPAGYKLDALTINGVDKFGAVENKTLTITADRAALEVEATFVKEQPIDISVTVKGKKVGTTAALAKNTQVKFSGIETPFTVNAEGKITGEGIIQGRYTVTVDGYLPKEITLDENLTEIVLEYDLFENLTLSWGWGDKTDLSKQNDGKLIYGSGVTRWLSTKSSYDSVAVSVTLLDGGHRQGVFIRFKGDTYAKDEYLMIQKENDEKISWNGEGNIWGNGSNILHETWTNYASPLTEESYTITLVREANRVFVFVNGKYCDTKTVDEKYADLECYVGVYCTGIPDGGFGEQTFNIEEDISAYRQNVAITDETEANGSVAIPQNIKVGDTVELTPSPKTGYVLGTLTVKDADDNVVATTVSNGKYTFVAMKTVYTVTATFIDAPANEAQAKVKGIGLGNTDVDMKDKTVSFKAENGTVTELIVNSESVVKGILLAGTYTVSVAGFYDLTATVGADGAFENLDNGFKFEKVIFTTNFINEGSNSIFGEGKPAVWSADNTHAASAGKIVSDKSGGKMYEWTTELYDDVALSVTLKSGNGNQGVLMCFGNESDNVQTFKQHAVRLRFENNKAQWIGGNRENWWWGTLGINDIWDFGDGGEYAKDMNATLLAKYNGEGLKLTILRKGGMVYALIDGKIYSAQSVDGCTDNKVRMAIFIEGATNGYEIPFEIDTNVDVILANASTAVGTDLTAYLGAWTVNENALTIAQGQRAYAEFKAAQGTLKELGTIHIKETVGGDQGLMYRFDNGKYIAVRYQKNNGDYKIQYTMDTVYYNGGSLKGWTDFFMEAAEKTTFAASGLDLTFVRDGKTFYTLLGDRILDTAVLEDKYATMGGAMAIMIWDSKGEAFAYSHATGDNIGYYTVNISVKDGAAHGYDIGVNKTIVKNGESSTLTIKTGSNWVAAWSFFPSSVKVNGVEKFVATDMVSNSANHLTYTLTLDNITENTTIEVVISKGTTIADGVIVTVKDNVGGTATCDSGKDGYYWNDGCDIFMVPAEGYEIESITVNDGTPVTEGWTFDSAKNRYVYTLPISITKQTTVVVAYKAVEQTPPVTE